MIGPCGTGPGWKLRSRVNTTKHGVAPHTSPFERVRCAKQGKKIYGLDSS